MRMYTMFTESHRQMMYDYFLPSLIPNEYLLTVKQFPQIGSGTFMTPGFAETVTHTFNILLDAIDENYGGYFVFSDCDIQFFGPTKAILLEAIDDCDLAAQKDSGSTLCTGFFICRANDTMKEVFKKCIELMERSKGRRYGDQDAVNECRGIFQGNDQDAVNNHNSLFRWKLLDAKQFWCPRRIWKPGHGLNVPRNILMHHANWTMGVPNKIAMLQYVKGVIEQSKVEEAGA